MKKELNVAAYESPKVKVVCVETEGVFCISTIGISHDAFTSGGELEF